MTVAEKSTTYTKVGVWGEVVKIDGACHCGAITCRAELDPASVGIWLCTDCQALSASAFRTLVTVQSKTFELLTGTPIHYVKVGDSANSRIQAICSDCGSGLYSCGVEDNLAAYNLRAGTVRQRADLVLRLECWTRSRLPWGKEVHEAEQVEGNPSA